MLWKTHFKVLQPTIFYHIPVYTTGLTNIYSFLNQNEFKMYVLVSQWRHLVCSLKGQNICYLDNPLITKLSNNNLILAIGT